ncbi:MAG TPA: glutaredoxin family protein [Coleofasciculaceae cyanobacterium]
MHLILYSKPGCHLCEGLQEKLEQIQSLPFDLEIRDITTRDDWFQAYQYEIPVLLAVKEPAANLPPIPLPRISPRASVQQIEQVLARHLLENPQNKSE